MGKHSKIEWLRDMAGAPGGTWTPIRARNLATGKIGWHCVHMSEGCRNCYAELTNLRWGTGLPFKPGHEADIEIFLDEKMLLAPTRWHKARRIFVCSMTDLFGDFVEDEWIVRMFDVMARCPQHTFIITTKRPERMREFMLVREVNGLPTLPNVWLGVSVENQETAMARIPFLLQTPAAVRWISAEPLLGPIDLTKIEIATAGPGSSFPAAPPAWMRINALAGTRAMLDHKRRGVTTDGHGRLDWIVVGGESSALARPMHPAWVRFLRDQCAAAGAPFFFKQRGEWTWIDDADAEANRGPEVPLDWRKRPSHVICMNSKGERRDGFSGGDEEFFVRVGKAAAGRLLDGRTHDDGPRIAT